MNKLLLASTSPTRKKILINTGIRFTCKPPSINEEKEKKKLIYSKISCYKGLKTKGGAAGVGNSTTSSVVICYSFILIINFLLTIVLNSSYNYFKQMFSSL